MKKKLKNTKKRWRKLKKENIFLKSEEIKK